MLGFLEQQAIFDSLNFAFLPWGHRSGYSEANLTALGTKIETFLCPSDHDSITELWGLAHNNYRACAGTMLINLMSDGDPSQSRNDGAFWLQSAIRPSAIRDGMSNTAAFSEPAWETRRRPTGSVITTISTTRPSRRVPPPIRPKRPVTPTVRSSGPVSAGLTAICFIHATNTFWCPTHRAATSATTTTGAP